MHDATAQKTAQKTCGQLKKLLPYSLVTLLSIHSFFCDFYISPQDQVFHV